MKKRMKNRWCAGLLAIVLVFALGGCGTSSKNFEAASDTAASQESGAEYEVTEEAVTDESWDDSAEMDTVADGGTTDTAGEVKAEAAQSKEKIIYTYNYSVETKAFDELMDTLQQRVNEYGGYVESSEVNGNSAMDILRYANMVIRIPADSMHSFLDMVEENSNVTYSNQTSEEVTLSYVDMESHIKALKTEQETLMGLLERATKLKDIITIQSQLTDVRYELESYESQLRVYDNRINYSTLYLDINEVQRETNVATELTYGQEIKQGLSDTFYNIGQGLREFSIWLIVNLPILLIWAVILVLVVLIVRKIVRIHAKRAARRADKGVWSSQSAEPKEIEASAEEKEKKK